MVAENSQIHAFAPSLVPRHVPPESPKAARAYADYEARQKVARIRLRSQLICDILKDRICVRPISDSETALIRRVATLCRRIALDSLSPRDFTPQELPFVSAPSLREETTPQKCCTKCGDSLPLTLVYFSTNGKKGWKAQCRNCQNEAARERRKRPEVRERRRVYKQEYYQSHPEFRERKLAHDREYRTRPEVAARYKVVKHAYYQTPERQAALHVYNNRPEVRERKRACDAKYRNRPEKRERRRAYLEEYYTRPLVQQRQKAYWKIHNKIYRNRPENYPKFRVWGELRRARKLAAKGSYTLAQIRELLTRQRYRCYYCSQQFEKRQGGKYIYHIDHTFPLSRTAHGDDPVNDISYLVLACPTCNVKKGNKFPHEFFEGGRLL